MSSTFIAGFCVGAVVGYMLLQEERKRSKQEGAVINTTDAASQATAATAAPVTVALPTAAPAEPVTVPLGPAAAETPALLPGDEDDEDLEDSDVIPPGVDLKLVVAVRSDLSMSKGKVAAQTGHAVLACYRAAQRACPENVKAWLFRGQAKITLHVPDEASMDKIAAAARAAGLVVSIIEDAGRTEVEPGTRTVMGIGPAPRGEIDAITGPKGAFPLRLLS